MRARSRRRALDWVRVLASLGRIQPMSFENTITEQDMDPAAEQFVQGLRGEQAGSEPDLDVDGLSESLLSRFLGLFGIGRRR
jgi:hypothetical protein